jgi:hypothetical protein
VAAGNSVEPPHVNAANADARAFGRAMVGGRARLTARTRLAVQPMRTTRRMHRKSELISVPFVLLALSTADAFPRID